MESPIRIGFATDFDGTVSEMDVAGLLLQKFADDEWLQIEEALKNGKITCREALKGQFELLRGEEQELMDHIDRHARIDPGFKPFLSLCQSKGIPIRILSEGLDFYIEYLLSKNDIEVEYFTNEAHFEDGGIRISFPYSSKDCEDCGTCKLELMRDWNEEGRKVAYAGDGVGDICPAESSDVVFAKGDLLSHFRSKGLDCIEFNDFADIISVVDGW